MSTYDSPAPTPSSHQNTFDTRLAYIQGSSSSHHQHNVSTSSSSTPLNRVPTTPSHPGCVLCSLVASTSDQLQNQSSNSPSARTALLPPGERSSSPSPLLARRRSGTSVNTNGKEVVYQDSQVTVYKAEGKERLCSDGKHLVVVLNKHVENVYEFGPSDVPLLSHIIDLSHQLLSSTAGQSSSTPSEAERGKGKGKDNDVRVGFVGNVMKDPQIPHSHLHAHAMVGPIDTSLPGATFWRRNVVFGPMNWWSIEDLRAEIREESSNNRVKSGYQHRDRAPIDRVPDAGSIAGLPNALDPLDYTDQSPPVSANKAHAMSRTLSVQSTGERGARSPSSPGQVFVAPSKGKEPDRSGGSESSRHSEVGEGEGEEGYVAVDLGDLSTGGVGGTASVSRVERGGRI
ncbi:hypothetical protein V866_000938 [Kwoniella sp. B9012]